MLAANEVVMPEVQTGYWMRCGTGRRSRLG